MSAFVICIKRGPVVLQRFPALAPSKVAAQIAHEHRADAYPGAQAVVYTPEQARRGGWCE